MVIPFWISQSDQRVIITWQRNAVHYYIMVLFRKWSTHDVNNPSIQSALFLWHPWLMIWGLIHLQSDMNLAVIITIRTDCQSLELSLCYLHWSITDWNNGEMMSGSGHTYLGTRKVTHGESNDRCGQMYVNYFTRLFIRSFLPSFIRLFIFIFLPLVPKTTSLLF